MEFLFQFMSEIFAMQEENDDVQMVNQEQFIDLINMEDGVLTEEDLVTQNIFSICEFH